MSHFKSLGNWWAGLLESTTPNRYHQRLKIRSRYHRLTWGLGLMAVFFLLTILGGDGDVSSSNGVVLVYLLLAMLFGLLGYLGGLYMSWWLSRLSPFNGLRAKSSKKR